MLTEQERRELDELGYVVLRGFMSPAYLAALRTRITELYAEEGARAGSEFRLEAGADRLANLVDKGEVFEQAVARPEILERVAYVLGPEFKLGSLNVRTAQPHSGGLQPLHVDMGRLPDERGNSVCNTVWLVDDFTPDNGPLRLVPGSHRWGKRPQEVLADPEAPHPEEIAVLGPAGDVVVMNAHTWHGGTGNRTAQPRTAMHGFYVRRDLPQQQYQKRLLRAETQARLTPALRRVLALDDPWNDELSASGELQSGFLK
jgi:ectoine hydroxylase-related dioxygenase (phytanoyl-CoA dioxygenase family)